MNSLGSTSRVLGVIVAGTLMLVPAVDAAKPKPPQKKGATYTGFTSQGTSSCRSGGRNDQPCSIFASVSKNGKKVGTKLLYYFAECADGKVLRSSTGFKNIPIKKGKYTSKATYDETLGTQGTAQNTVVTHGKFKRSGKKYSLSGDYSIKSDLTFSDGSTTHCESGKVTFTATTQ
jgi:hypothetical protein